MAKKPDIKRLRQKAIAELASAIKRYNVVLKANMEHLTNRWIASMTAVELHAIWERYAENRLVFALSHNPKHFLQYHGIKSITSISMPLAKVLVRGGRSYFDFRSCGDLIGHGNRLVGKIHNPFEAIAKDKRVYLDTLASIRNMIVHKSESAAVGYKKSLKDAFSVSSAPTPEEFLHALDVRKGQKKKHRIEVLAEILRTVLEGT